jgi:hypothetical protein
MTLASTPPTDERPRNELAARIATAIVELAAQVPRSTEALSPEPVARSRALTNKACIEACAISGTLALPPGPLGILTIVPDLIAVWRVQAQMVADIAAAFGKSATLTPEQMLYCLFKHAAAQAVRDLAMRAGERILFRPATLRLLQTVAQRLGVRVTERVIAKSAARYLPVIGALGVGAYAYYDTAKVAATAIELFQSEIGTESDA